MTLSTALRKFVPVLDGSCHPEQAGFKVLPRGWVVERTFAWLGRYRPLSKDHERCTTRSKGVIYIVSIHTMLKRIAPTA
jgi:transposase